MLLRLPLPAARCKKLKMPLRFPSLFLVQKIENNVAFSPAAMQKKRPALPLSLQCAGRVAVFCLTAVNALPLCGKLFFIFRHDIAGKITAMQIKADIF